MKVIQALTGTTFRQVLEMYIGKGIVRGKPQYGDRRCIFVYLDFIYSYSLL